MRFGEIIKKAWHITWHYRWLWVLGVFAGVTGGSSGGGGGSGGGNGSSWRQSFGSGTGGSGADMPDFTGFLPTLQHWLPFILIVTVLFVIIGIAFAVIGIGARGGLVWAVNEIEEGRAPRLGEAWNAGFARFWSIFGLGLLLQGTVAIAGLILAAVVLIPILGPLARGDEPNAAAVLGPMCGVLAIGVPVLIVAALVLGIMYITGLRFVMLNGMGTMQAAGESWRAFRARFGDHALMYIISLGLSFVAGLALAIPIVVVSLATIVPAVVAGVGKNWGLLAGMIALFIGLLFVLGLAFTAVWGTFTSAMWTIFFRRLTGREVLVAVPVGYPPPSAPAYAQPGPSPTPQQQAAPSPQAPETAPTYAPPQAPPMYAPPPAPPAQDMPPAPPMPTAPPAPDA
jgi:hypothetical protein